MKGNNMAGSFQNEIPPARINLKLDVGKGDTRKKVELPFKILVTGDFSKKKKSERISDMEKINIHKNNLEQVMEGLDLSLDYEVEDKLTREENRTLTVHLKIKNMKSFRPESVAKSIPAISRLLAARNLLKDLKSNLIDNREFRRRLEEILRDNESSRALLGELQKLIPDSTEQTVSEA
jgi:type VI secretion system protein ImpB